MLTWLKRLPWPVLWAVWLATRACLYLAATVPGRNGDISIYQHWYTCCYAHGSFPLADAEWQYPPGAALVFWLPGLLPGSYIDNFVFLMIACDLAITLMLCGWARRGGSRAGPWYWVCGMPFLGAIAITRFDLVPVALVVAALTVRTTAGRGVVRGILAGAGAAIKAWPLALLAGVVPGHGRRATAAAAAVLVAVWAVFPSQTVSFLTHQDARGVEIESVAATPFMIWRQAGWNGSLVFRFGAFQLSGGHAGLAQDGSRLGLVLVIAGALVWQLLLAAGRIRWRPEFAADVPLALTLLGLVVSPVLSPQYLLWVIGLAAVCLATGQTRQRPAAVAVLVIAGLTQLIFPVGWPSLLDGSGLLTAVLVVRNLLLVLTAAFSCWRVIRARQPLPAADLTEHEVIQATAAPGAAATGTGTLHRRP